MLKRRDFYETVIDPKLAHQIRLLWAGVRVEARCNCGHLIGRYRPEWGDITNRVRTSYADHVDEVLREQAARASVS